VLGCYNLCGNNDDFPNGGGKWIACIDNCGCIDMAAKVYKKRQQVVTMLSQVDSSGEICDDSEPTEPPKKSKSTKGDAPVNAPVNVPRPTARKPTQKPGQQPTQEPTQVTTM